MSSPWYELCVSEMGSTATAFSSPENGRPYDGTSGATLRSLPSALSTVTSAGPNDPGGATAVRKTIDCTLTDCAGRPRMRTRLPPSALVNVGRKPAPVTVTTLPPLGSRKRGDALAALTGAEYQ